MIARALLAALLASAALPALADDVPSYNVERSCIDAARRAGARDNTASPDCVQGEAEARTRVTELWPTLSPGARQRCTRLSDRRSSYLILSACIEREAAIQR